MRTNADNGKLSPCYRPGLLKTADRQKQQKQYRYQYCLFDAIECHHHLLLSAQKVTVYLIPYERPGML